MHPNPTTTPPFWGWHPNFLESSPPPLGEYAPPPGLDIVWGDEDLVVIHKPAGLLSVPGRAACYADSVLTRVRQRFPKAQVVNRLDLPTSGLMVVALHFRAESRLKAQFRERRTRKGYLAVVAGRLCASHGHITLPMRCDLDRRPMQIICLEHGKPAWTEFSLVERRVGTTVLMLEPHTGRSHQLRLHLAAIGHPIMGDPMYAPPAVASDSPRLLLHAATLGFFHPTSGQWCAFEAPCPFTPKLHLPRLLPHDPVWPID
jgi:tRNA pseudouridine32 synthase/23S rRNA pseudouridine746 synthase